MKKYFAPFLARLKLLRGKENQGKFAKKLGLKQGSYSRYETGEREPDLRTLCQIAESAGVSSDWLLGLTDEPSTGVSLTASGGSVAANHSTVSTGGAVRDAEVSRLLSIIESQQRVIEALSCGKAGRSSSDAPQLAAAPPTPYGS
ncbi:MAG: helix-turn-helix transcriptional regulator [Kiritimatiellae bacterium]|nr:helix-turn-helix transcriptional regulator [Kiritimatiellia bacterium]